MTEEEAKGKKCPLLFLGNLAMMLGTDMRTKVDSECVGSACMMWRATAKEEVGGKEEIVDIGGGQRRIEWKTIYADAGFCGLAGKV